MNPVVSPNEHDRLILPPALVADWRDFVFLHFSLEPADLAPHVPHPLDLHDGKAFVSLVSFRLERLRPARGLPAALGRWLLRPMSDHLFLNVRTYVRGPAGPGIHFIAEWIDNSLSLRLGPLAYGLPYQLAEMERRELPGTGLRRIAVRDPHSQQAMQVVVPASRPEPPREYAAGTTGAFLLERHVAYTQRRGVDRWFAVEHPRWSATPFQLARFDPALFETVYPWFARATFVGGHLAEGFADVMMSAPARLARAVARRVPATAPAAVAGR